MRILIASDAWVPQVNGVVRTLEATQRALVAMGHVVDILSPDMFRTVPCPGYAEIRLACPAPGAVGRLIRDCRPDAIHIATEGPLGLAVRRWCRRGGIGFTTAYHTQFPAYLARWTGLPASLFWRYIAWFHRPAAAIFVSTHGLARELEARGLRQTRLWGRGVDFDCFGPDIAADSEIASLPRPIQLYVGRVAVEKSVDAFLALRTGGTKIVVGDGPLLEPLRRRFPEAHFLGRRSGPALAAAYAAADVFVFPSRTDTFGLVMIEALACGTPVAAFPVPGPSDVLDPSVGAMADDLAEAVAQALTRDRTTCAAFAARFNWTASAAQFVADLVPAVCDMPDVPFALALGE